MHKREEGFLDVGLDVFAERGIELGDFLFPVLVAIRGA